MSNNLFACSAYKEAKFSSKYAIYRLTLSRDGFIVMKPVQKQFTREYHSQIFQCIPCLRYRYFVSQLGHGIELSNEDDDSDISFVIAKMAQFKEFVLTLCSVTTVVGIEVCADCLFYVPSIFICALGSLCAVTLVESRIVKSC